MVSVIHFNSRSSKLDQSGDYEADDFKAGRTHRHGSLSAQCDVSDPLPVCYTPTGPDRRSHGAPKARFDSGALGLLNQRVSRPVATPLEITQSGQAIVRPDRRMPQGARGKIGETATQIAVRRGAV